MLLLYHMKEGKIQIDFRDLTYVYITFMSPYFGYVDSSTSSCKYACQVHSSSSSTPPSQSSSVVTSPSIVPTSIQSKFSSYQCTVPSSMHSRSIICWWLGVMRSAGSAIRSDEHFTVIIGWYSIALFPVGMRRSKIWAFVWVGDSRGKVIIFLAKRLLIVALIIADCRWYGEQWWESFRFRGERWDRVDRWSCGITGRKKERRYSVLK